MRFLANMLIRPRADAAPLEHGHQAARPSRNKCCCHRPPKAIAALGFSNFGVVLLLVPAEVLPNLLAEPQARVARARAPRERGGRTRAPRERVGRTEHHGPEALNKRFCHRPTTAIAAVFGCGWGRGDCEEKPGSRGPEQARLTSSAKGQPCCLDLYVFVRF
jgi:hypothetical protein